MIHAQSDGYRDAVILADIEGLSHKEVAQRLGLSLSATKSRVLRGPGHAAEKPGRLFPIRAALAEHSD